MKFFFAENIDRVDPAYNFITDTPSDEVKVFSHELFPELPFDGLLVSKATIESSKSRCTQSERHRIRREGIKSFLRLPSDSCPVIGDCGSFSALQANSSDEVNVEDTHEFYQNGGFDFGVSPDFIVPEFSSQYDKSKNRSRLVQERVEGTFQLIKSSFDYVMVKKRILNLSAPYSFGA